MKKVKTRDYERLDLEDGTYLYLQQTHGPYEESGLTFEEYSRNVVRMKDSGEVLWRIASDYDYLGNPFINLDVEEDPYIVARWDGFTYKVDPETGWAVLFEFVK